MWIISGLGQAFIHPDFNLFRPLHKFLYIIFEVNGPVEAQSNSKCDCKWNDEVAWDIIKKWVKLIRLSLFVFIGGYFFHILKYKELYHN